MIYKLLFIALCIFIIYKLSKVYFVKEDTCVVYVGGLGSGKSIVSSSKAKQLLSKNRFKVWRHNLVQMFKKNKDKWQRPILYSTIPIRISKYEWSTPLDADASVLETALTPRSVVFMDEVSLFMSQMLVKTPNADSIEEFFTLFRHYTQGGYLVINTQNTSKVNFHIRYCLNRAYQLSEFRKIWHIYFVKVRNISLVDDVKSISTGNLEDDTKTIVGWIPFRKVYDTYAYSGRVSSLPPSSNNPYTKYKTNKIARIPIKKAENKNINNED